MKPVLTSVLLAISTLSFAHAAEHKNIIMIVGDGMGPAYTTGYRYYNDDPNTKVVENTVFDRHLVGMSSTHPSDEHGAVTDSAASATALATGTKTYNGAISVDNDKNPLETILEKAKRLGKKTGVVVTSQINHATPAAYLSHNESRRNYNEIADSYLDDGVKADLLLGGGWKYFIRKDRNLVNEFKNAGFHYLDSYAQLNALPKNKPVLGLFADVGLPWAIDDNDKHRLSTMTKAATEYLDNDKGYFLLIEASQVDWAGHGNDVTSAMAEMDDLAKTLEFLEEYVKSHPDTIVVLTADHSTGGLTLGADKKYQWHPEILKQMTSSPEVIAKQLAKEEITAAKLAQLFPFTFSDDEYSTLLASKKEAQQKLTEFMAMNEDQGKGKRKPNVEYAIHKSITHIIDKRTTTGWTTGGHTGVDVPVFALGAHNGLFNGYQDNTDIAKKLIALLETK